MKHIGPCPLSVYQSGLDANSHKQGHKHSKQGVVKIQLATTANSLQSFAKVTKNGCAAEAAVRRGRDLKKIQKLVEF